MAQAGRRQVEDSHRLWQMGTATVNIYVVEKWERIGVVHAMWREVELTMMLVRNSPIWVAYSAPAAM